MNTRHVLLGLVVLVSLMLLAACSPSPAPIPTTPPTAAPVLAPATPAGVTVTDSAGRSVTINGTPQRIISLAPSTTEMAFALGLGDRVIAADTYSDFPDQAKNLPKIKTFPVNYEQVVALKPDLILAAGIQSAEDIKKLSDLQLTVLVVGSSKTTFENVMTDIKLVGQATGRQTQARTVTDEMRKKLNELQAKVAQAQGKPRVYWELDATDPTKPFAPGPGSFVHDIIVLAGGVNVAANAKAPYAQISAEEVIAANPEIIILSDAAYGITVESVKARQGWSAITAVKNDRVLPIDDNLVSRPGPRIVQGLEAAARLIHPELFR